MLDTLIADPGKITVVLVLVIGLVMTYRIFIGGLAVPRYLHEQIVLIKQEALAAKDKELERVRADCQFQRELNVDLLRQLNDAIGVVEKNTRTVAKISRAS